MKPAAHVTWNQVSKEASSRESACAPGAACPGITSVCRPGNMATVEQESKKSTSSPEEMQGSVPSAYTSCVAQVCSNQAGQILKSDKNSCHTKTTPCSLSSVIAQALPPCTFDSKTLLKSKAQEQDEWADVSSGELFCELAQEMDKWEEEFEQGKGVTGTVQGSVAEVTRGAKMAGCTPGGVSASCESPLHVVLSRTPGAVSVSRGNPLRAPVVSTLPNAPGVVTHVAPVTLLPTMASSRWGLSDDPARGFHGADKGSGKAVSEGMPRLLCAGSQSAFVHCSSSGNSLRPVHHHCEELSKTETSKSPSRPYTALGSRGQNFDGRVSPRGELWGFNSRTEITSIQGLPGAFQSELVRGSCGPINTVGSGPVLFPCSGLQQKGEDIERQLNYTPVRPNATSGALHSPATIEETPPQEQGRNAAPSHGVVSISERRDSSSGTQRATSTHPSVSSEGGSFKTPNISRWLNSKRADFSSPLPSSFVPSGGKVTPPLCGCGRRAKRKFVSNPGPNEGMPFYVCPNSRGSDRKLGCNYFKWEKCDSNSAEPLLSDYGECS